MSRPTLAVIVVAAGRGTRLGVLGPKAFVDLDGRSILARALDSAFGMQREAQVIVVAPAGMVERARTIAEAIARGVSGHLTVVAGGESRQASVAAGLAVLQPGIQIVLVHDAARALAPPRLLDAVADAVERCGHGVIPGLPLSDTVKRTDAVGGIHETVDRSGLAAVQTPQGFPREDLVAAYAAATAERTDDAALVSDTGRPVSVIEGDPLAFKITTAWDLRRAEELLRVAPEFRTGLGVDAHAFDGSARLWLAGLEWPGEVGLAGHSDGDVVAHAITDALLSAAGLGDIGTVFGTSDPRHTDAHGDVFLRAARELVEAAGYRIGNVSVQLIGNRPRFTPRREEAQGLLTGILQAPVSVSATTTDGLGFTGCGEGIAAVATALLRAK